MQLKSNLVEGVVKRIDPLTGDGQIISKQNDVVHFHGIDLQLLEEANGELYWKFLLSKGLLLKCIEEGDDLLFEMCHDIFSGRLLANPWTLKSAVISSIFPPTYRLMGRAKIKGDWAEANVVWEGYDPNDPHLPTYWTGFVHDFLTDDHAPNIEAWFEYSRDYGVFWFKCPPPVHLMKSS